MFCTYCKVARVENEEPCVNCGAPSPLLNRTVRADQGPNTMNTPGRKRSNGAGISFGAQWEQQVPQLTFDEASNGMNMDAQRNYSSYQSYPEEGSMPGFSAPYGQRSSVNNAAYVDVDAPMPPNPRRPTSPLSRSANPYAEDNAPMPPQARRGGLSGLSAPSWQKAPKLRPTTGGLAQASPSTWQQPSMPEPENPLPPWQQPSAPIQASPALSWQQPASQPLPEQDMGFMPGWQQPTSRPLTGGLENGNPPNQSALVPYQGGMNGEMGGNRPTLALQLVPNDAIQNLIPIEQARPTDAVTYIAPEYTKPRPIIPKKRAISGMISVLIVALLLCSGAGYYVKASGLWNNITNLYTGNAQMANIAQSTVNIPNPPQITSKDFGPAYPNIITSAALDSRISTEDVGLIPATIYSLNQPIYLTLNIQIPANRKNESFTVKWYTNSLPYRTDAPTSPPDNTKKSWNASDRIAFPNPVEGSVEVYWSDNTAQNQFAARLYFAVR